MDQRPRKPIGCLLIAAATADHRRSHNTSMLRGGRIFSGGSGRPAGQLTGSLRDPGPEDGEIFTIAGWARSSRAPGGLWGSHNRLPGRSLGRLSSQERCTAAAHRGRSRGMEVSFKTLRIAAEAGLNHPGCPVVRKGARDRPAPPAARRATARPGSLEMARGWRAPLVQAPMSPVPLPRGRTPAVERDLARSSAGST